MSERNCAFQYATTGRLLRLTSFVCDETELTIDEAKELWNKHYPDCAEWIKDGNSAEMVIWINMESPNSYNEYLHYISTDAKSDGVSIWYDARNYFPRNIE